MIAIRDENPTDIAARETLLDACFGQARFEKTSERLRAGRLPSDGLARVATGGDGTLLGTIRLWDVAAGPGRPALLLGPLAVDPHRRGLGIGAALMRDALARATALGHGAVLLVGDASYYARFGFRTETTTALRLPGPCEPGRFLAHELRAGALTGAAGLVVPSGRFDPALAPTLPRAARKAA